MVPFLPPRLTLRHKTLDAHELQRQKYRLAFQANKTVGFLEYCCAGVASPANDEKTDLRNQGLATKKGVEELLPSLATVMTNFIECSHCHPTLRGRPARPYKCRNRHRKYTR